MQKVIKKGMLNTIIIKSRCQHRFTCLCHSTHPSLSLIDPGRTSKLHPMSAQNCCRYVLVDRLTLARPFVGVHIRNNNETDLTSEYPDLIIYNNVFHW